MVVTWYQEISNHPNHDSDLRDAHKAPNACLLLQVISDKCSHKRSREEEENALDDHILRERGVDWRDNENVLKENGENEEID